MASPRTVSSPQNPPCEKVVEKEKNLVEEQSMETKAPTTVQQPDEAHKMNDIEKAKLKKPTKVVSIVGRQCSCIIIYGK